MELLDLLILKNLTANSEVGGGRDEAARILPLYLHLLRQVRGPYSTNDNKILQIVCKKGNINFLQTNF
jgi:hypothetical protein